MPYGLTRFMALAVMAFYIIMPHAAFGLTGSGCTCVQNSMKCGQHGFVCHCCTENELEPAVRTFISKCRATSSEFNMAHPPAILGPMAMIVSEPVPEGCAQPMETLFNDISLPPPLRPPNALPFCQPYTVPY